MPRRPRVPLVPDDPPTREQALAVLDRLITDHDVLRAALESVLRILELHYDDGGDDGEVVLGLEERLELALLIDRAHTLAVELPEEIRRVRHFVESTPRLRQA